VYGQLHHATQNNNKNHFHLNYNTGLTRRSPPLWPGRQDQQSACAPLAAL